MRKESVGEEEKDFPNFKAAGDNLSLDAVSNSSEEDNEEIKIYCKDIENKSSEEILTHLKNELGIEEGEYHLI